MLLVGLALVVVLVAGAWVLGEIAERRYSKAYARVAAWISPLSSRLHRVPDQPTALPFHEAFSGSALDAGWYQLNTDFLDWSVTDGALTADTNRLCVWIGNQQGPYFYRYVDGDFEAVLQLRVRKASDTSQPPDFNWQFGGLMARDPVSDAWFGRENNVFAVVGHRGRRLEVETKSTRDGRSDIVTEAWQGGDAELRMTRTGDTLALAARVSRDDAWREINRVRRPDLPHRLQLGLIAYSSDDGDGRFDLRAFFDDLSVTEPNGK